MLSRTLVLPDGLTAREAATSWRVYRFGCAGFLGPAVGRAFICGVGVVSGGWSQWRSG